MLTMWSKRVSFTLAEDISEVVVVQRNSGEIRIVGSGRSGVEITLLRADLQAELDEALKTTGQCKSRGTLIIIMGGALHWEKLGGVLDGVRVAEGGKSGGCGDELGGAGMFCPDKRKEILPETQSINGL